MLRLLTLALSALLLAAATREWRGEEPCADPAEPVAEEDALPQQPEAPVPQAPPVPAPPLPAAEQVAALPPETRVAQASAIKTALIGQYMRMVRENHRMSPGNLRESADAARLAGAPDFWQQAMLALAGNALSDTEHRELESRIRDFYALYRVDALAVRLFVETSDLTQEEIADLLPCLPMEHLFNLPPQETATPGDLAEEAAILKDVFAALADRFQSVHDTASADAAADALIPCLAPFNRTQRLRLATPQQQVEAFAAYRDFFPPTAQIIDEQRLRIYNAGFFSSAKLRALSYLLQ